MVRILILCAGMQLALGQSPLERAVTLAREKNYSEARKALEGVPEPLPISQRIAFYRLKAGIAAGLGEAVTAAVEMQSALSLAPTDGALLLATAVAEFQASSFDSALKHAKAAGNNATAKALIGDIEDRRGKFEEAVKAYREAVALAPDREAYRITLALHLIRRQTFDPAIALLRESAQLFPRSARIRTLLGIGLYAHSDIEEAIASLLEALAIDPQSESAHRCLAQIVLQSSSAPLPSVVERLCSWNDTVCSALRLRISRVNDDPKMEVEALDRLKLAPPSDLTARCELARAYEWTGQLEKARMEMETCVQLDASPQNHYRMGLIYRRLGLAGLARKQMDLRNQALEKMTEDTAAGLNSLKSFQ